MDLSELLPTLQPPERKKREAKDKPPPTPCWDRAMAGSLQSIATSIEQAEGAIVKGDWATKDNPVKVGNTTHTTYFAAKNWTLTNRQDYDKNKKNGLFEVSMTVGTTQKFKCLPKIVWKDGVATQSYAEDKQGNTAWGKTDNVPESQVMTWLKSFQDKLQKLDKNSDDGKIFWEQAKAQAKPNVKKGQPETHRYNASTDLWDKV